MNVGWLSASEPALAEGGTVLPQQTADVVASQFAWALDGESVSFEGDYADRTFLVNAVPLSRSTGEVDEILVLSIDITRRKRAEEELERYSEHLEDMVDKRTQELREAQERMVRQEKLATLGCLAGSVSRSEPPIRREIDLNQVLDQMLAQLETPEQVEVVARLDDYVPEIRGDPNQLR